ncbi:MAG TPA: amino acid adenylation domain-containing protein [Haliangium sp.]|nr:amino acid adenylation domain-containing protein [Haliangium sp.]
MAFRSALDRFLARAASQPDAPAILVDGRLAHTYASLARAALRTGAILRDRGAGPDDLVGIALPRSAELVAAILGAWAAGAAFTVLDPALPPARRAVQIHEGRVRWILTTAPHQAGLEADLDEHQLDGSMQGLIDIIDPGQDHRVEIRARPVPAAAEHLAYAYWTSGSTGRPKGVAVEHGGLLGMVEQQIAACGLGPGQRTLFVLGIGFDASLADVCTTLLSGACLCIESALGQPGTTAETLMALLHDREITYVDLPPSLLALLDPAGAPPSLRTVLIGGEVCPVETVRAWSRRVRLVNAYGPTEATICTSMCICTPDWDRPLLGAPLLGVIYRVVDEDLREVASGQPGQLAIGGVQLARGYVAQPELEATRFVSIAGARHFLTGDQVVREPGGAYRFLGRVDRQLKLRGQLVAPEEVEAALAGHAGVARAHVLARAHGGRTLLIAFVARRPGGDPSVDELRRHLARRLPAWMLPQSIHVLDALPETATGKIDVAALAALPAVPAWPALDDERAVPGDGRASDVAEVALAQAAARVLGVLDAGVIDLRRGFVSLGGDSLAVIQMAATCAAAGVTVSASDLAADVPLRALARGQGAGPGMSASVLDQAAALPPDVAARLAAAPPATRRTPGAILVTGATGFLGSRLVLELGQRSSATVLCLVRARDPGHAWQRLRAACDVQAPGQLGALGRRVRAIAGDLTAPLLGLDARGYEALASEIDAVYHCAAQVNMLAPFAALAPHNLGGTAAVLRLCLHGARKPLHYASTLSVFVSTDRGRAEEIDDLSATRTVFGGYAQSKWAAERLVQRVAADLPAAVYRFGLITGDPDRGALPGHDALILLTRGLAAMGAVPAAWLDTLAVDVTPLGFAAAAMAAIGLGAGAPGTYHIAGRAPVPLRAWIDAMRAAGVTMDDVSEEDWHARRLAQPGAPDQPGRAGSTSLARAFAFLGLCRGAGASDFAAHRALDVFEATDMTFDTRHADAALRGAGIERPAATPEILARYVQRILEEVT